MADPTDHESVGVEQAALIASLQEERDELRAALDVLSSGDAVSTAEYQQFVERSALGMAERDDQPLPRSVTTRGGFYEVMAGAALEAIGLQTLLERIPPTERQLPAAPRSSVARPPAPRSTADRARRGRHSRRRLRSHKT
jgi:hypothetical protein